MLHRYLRIWSFNLRKKCSAYQRFLVIASQDIRNIYITKVRMHLTVISQFLMYPYDSQEWVCSRWALNNVCKTFINITICCHFTPGYFLFYFFKYFFLSFYIEPLSCFLDDIVCSSVRFFGLFDISNVKVCISLENNFFLGAFSFFCRLFSIPQYTTLQGLQNMFTTKNQWSIYEFTL